MKKDFDKWNREKKKVDAQEIQRDLFFHEREVWWCKLGINIGVETDGKNQNYERPILIIKKFNNAMLWAVPLTSKERSTPHHLKITHEAGISWVCLSQIRTVSTKRLLRKIGMISETDFKDVLERIIYYIKIEPRISAGFSEAEATNA
jgi:mRNA interferase MazF